MKISKEFIRYCLVGVVNTLVGIGTSLICLNLFSLNYWVSTAIGYAFGITVSFLLNKKYTFENKSTSIASQFMKFVTLMIPNYFVSNFLGLVIAPKFVILPIISDILNFINLFLHLENAKLTTNIAVLIGMVIYILIGFFGSKLFVFKTKPTEPELEPTENEA